MKADLSLAGLETYARDQIAADRYPNDRHTFRPASCQNHGVVPVIVTIEHHTGSRKDDFKGLITVICSTCEAESRFLSFTGSHRKPERQTIPTCQCGHNTFLTGECERIEGADGIPGFFDEGVVVGQCSNCGRFQTFVYTD